MRGRWIDEIKGDRCIGMAFGNCFTEILAMSGIYGRIIIMSNTLENSFIFANFTPSYDCHVPVKT